MYSISNNARADSLGSLYGSKRLYKAMASKTADVRPKITLACTGCKERNYITKKNRRNNPDRMAMNKYCPRCGRHTEHRETR